MDCNPAGYHKDAMQAVSSSADRCVKVWDLNRGHMLQQKMWGSTPNAVRYAPDGTLVASGHHDGTLRFWDFRMKKLANEVAGLHTREICSVAIGRRTGIPCPCSACTLSAMAINVSVHLYSKGRSSASSWQMLLATSLSVQHLALIWL